MESGVEGTGKEVTTITDAVRPKVADDWVFQAGRNVTHEERPSGNAKRAVHGSPFRPPFCLASCHLFDPSIARPETFTMRRRQPGPAHSSLCVYLALKAAKVIDNCLTPAIDMRPDAIPHAVPCTRYVHHIPTAVWRRHAVVRLLVGDNRDAVIRPRAGCWVHGPTAFHRGADRIQSHRAERSHDATVPAPVCLRNCKPRPPRTLREAVQLIRTPHPCAASPNGEPAEETRSVFIADSASMTAPSGTPASFMLRRLRSRASAPSSRSASSSQRARLSPPAESATSQVSGVNRFPSISRLHNPACLHPSAWHGKGKVRRADGPHPHGRTYPVHTHRIWLNAAANPFFTWARKGARRSAQ
jgi:hypothetical protein